ncbi:unnamed protein product [Mycetohabitans rhizoxinica HKI 454]|jgi:hypothetical protein|uniref:Uncharacterized protein n=1 Tax=Mycetohabitans rhizoxinica (strain DSM 19002 / CIP 109453 / HKI 454) TaxID=882378 RepID=E5AP44_MYCRK|nr:unnamed protein product [Mycetohabitans rhizoxinica HKI 454]
MQQYRFGSAPFRHGALKRVKRVVFQIFRYPPESQSLWQGEADWIRMPEGGWLSD